MCVIKLTFTLINKSCIKSTVIQYLHTPFSIFIPHIMLLLLLPYVKLFTQKSNLNDFNNKLKYHGDKCLMKYVRMDCVFVELCSECGNIENPHDNQNMVFVVHLFFETILISHVRTLVKTPISRRCRWWFFIWAKCFTFIHTHPNSIIPDTGEVLSTGVRIDGVDVVVLVVEREREIKSNKQ